MNRVVKYAPAKINLALDVLRRREDGYHEVRMIMQTVRLHDRLMLQRSRDHSISLRTNLNFLPVNENNLVYKAVSVFRNTYGIADGVSCTLDKRIPVAAGLAGGSSDAAAALHGMNELFHINAPLSELLALGVTIGADVPYCLTGGTALSEGIGERLTPLSKAPFCHCVIVKPQISLSTRFVYEHLTLDHQIMHPDIDSMLSAIEQGSLSKLSASVGNVLESVSVPLHPEIAEIKNEMLEFGALCSLMSGSGPSVFGLFLHRAEAEKAFYRFKSNALGRQTFLTCLS
jgi:4-diphosphocytidyl-2-C-methyl-D-erythritol kinase